MELLSEGAPEDRVGVLYNGVDLAPFNAEFDHAAERRRLELSTNTLILTIVANLIPYKGHLDLIDALAEIDAKLPADWVLQIVGRDDGLGGAIKTRADGLGISEHLRFLGLRADVPKLLRLSDIGLLTSHEEGFSNAVLEGMAARLAMVVTDVGGNGEAVLHGKQGIVVPPHEPRMLAKAILELAGDPERRHALSKNAYQRVQDFFSLDACVENYCRLYDAILNGDNPGLEFDRVTPINVRDD